MYKIDNRNKCRNCRVGLTCSICGRNHDDVRPDYYLDADVICTYPKLGVIGYACRDICKCEDTIIIRI